MLILLRQVPDDRLQDLLSSIAENQPSCQLVYLENSLSDLTTESGPFFLEGRTFTMEDSPFPALEKIDAHTLLSLVRENRKILILP